MLLRWQVITLRQPGDSLQQSDVSFTEFPNVEACTVRRSSRQGLQRHAITARGNRSAPIVRGSAPIVKGVSLNAHHSVPFELGTRLVQSCEEGVALPGERRWL